MELTIEQKSVFIHVIAGTVMGYLSGVMSSDPLQIGNLTIILLMIGILVFVGQTVQKIFKLSEVTDETGDKKYDIKWWMSNGGLLYIGFWLLAWIVMYNRFLVG